jgi:hypothetical protein
VNISFILGVGSAIVWGFLGLGVLFTLGAMGRAASEPSFVMGEAICVAGLALSLLSLRLASRGHGGTALALACGTSLLAIIGLAVFVIMMGGEPPPNSN